MKEEKILSLENVKEKKGRQMGYRLLKVVFGTSKCGFCYLFRILFWHRGGEDNEKNKKNWASICYSNCGLLTFWLSRKISELQASI